MTPEEKAKELIEKFKPHAYNGACEEDDERMELHHAKQSALICVDEILKITPAADMSPARHWLEKGEPNFTQYWEQVKQLIINPERE